MRISDWSSDVCSSDLLERNEHAVVVAALRIVGSRQALFIQQHAHAERERWITVRAVLDLIGVFGKTVVVVDQRRLWSAADGERRRQPIPGDQQNDASTGRQRRADAAQKIKHTATGYR